MDASTAVLGVLAIFGAMAIISWADPDGDRADRLGDLAQLRAHRRRTNALGRACGHRTLGPPPELPAGFPPGRPAVPSDGLTADPAGHLSQ